ncbi:MAG: MFS transporter [Candidatus Omnitrophica bacterium]|nr:MFS transporter [Candidatus Omnitrophota bacterium]
MKILEFLTHSRNRNFQRLWFAQLISQFGDRIHQLALVGLVYEKASGSPVILAKLLTFTIIPVFIIQPFAGVFVDRWDRRLTLFICDIFRGLLVLLIPFIFFFWKSLIPIYIIVFFVFCFSRFYLPAKMSIIPDIVQEDELLIANSLVSTTGMIAFVMGCALGGFLIDWFGARNGFIIDSLTFFISGAIIFFIALPSQLKLQIKEFKEEKIWQQVKEKRKSVWVEIKEGLVYLRQQKDIRFVINMLFILLASAGAVYVTMIVFIQHEFKSITKHLGVMAVCLGVGLFLGAVLYGRYGKKFAWHKVIFFCLIVGGMMLMCFALFVHNIHNVFLTMVLATVLGLVIGPVFIASNTIVHLVSDEAMRGKVFSALEIVIHFAFLVSMLLSSWLSQFIGQLWILLGAGFLIAIVGVVGFVKNRKGQLAFTTKNVDNILKSN